jgi:hypothetical protein
MQKKNQDRVEIFCSLSLILHIKSGSHLEKVGIISLKKHACHFSNKDRYKLLYEVRKNHVNVSIENTMESQ